MNNIQDLPQPEELIKKSATRSISLRVNEDTISAFERYAKLYDTTTSALINNLLDAYAKRLDTTNISEMDRTQLAIKMMDSMLHKKAMKIRFKTRDELEQVLSCMYDVSYHVKLDHSINPGSSDKDLSGEGIVSVEFDNDYICFMIGGSRKTKKTVANGWHRVEVPYMVWPHVVMMLLAYKDAYKELNVSKQEDQEKYFIEEFLDKIIERIDATIGRPDELVSAMEKLLLHNFESLLRDEKIKIESKK